MRRLRVIDDRSHDIDLSWLHWVAGLIFLLGFCGGVQTALWVLQRGW